MSSCSATMTAHGHLLVGSTADLAAARESAYRTAARALGEERAHDVELVVSELVTNGLENGVGGPTHLDVVIDESGRLSVCVTSAGNVLPEPPVRLVEATETRGRGLYIVGVLSDDVSISSGGGRIEVIARFDPR